MRILSVKKDESEEGDGNKKKEKERNDGAPFSHIHRLQASSHGTTVPSAARGEAPISKLVSAMSPCYIPVAKVSHKASPDASAGERLQHWVED